MSLEQFILENEISLDMVDFYQIAGVNYLLLDNGELIEIKKKDN